MPHLDPDRLALLALREAEPPAPSGDAGSDDHLLDCDVCRHELAQLSRTVDLARSAGELGVPLTPALPASIWAGIATEIGIGQDGRREPHASAPAAAPHSHRAVGVLRRHRRPLQVVAALIVAAAVAFGAGMAIGRHGSGPSVAGPGSRVSQAQLSAMSAAVAGAHGTATISPASDGLRLQVDSQALPLRQGYYEVWLFDPVADHMVAVGTLGTDGQGQFTLPATIDLRSYDIVDVSAQNFDGNPAHQGSVLRGTLTQ